MKVSERHAIVLYTQKMDAGYTPLTIKQAVQAELAGWFSAVLFLVGAAAVTGLILGALAVAYINGNFGGLSGDVVGPPNANHLSQPFAGINCSDEEAAFGLKAETNGRAVTATCLVPNSTFSGNVTTLGGGCFGPTNNNSLNVMGTANRVTITASAAGLYTFNTPQDTNAAANPTWNLITSTGGVRLPNPGSSAATLDTYENVSGILSMTGPFTEAAVPYRVVKIGRAVTLCIEGAFSAPENCTANVAVFTGLPSRFYSYHNFENFFVFAVESIGGPDNASCAIARMGTEAGAGFQVLIGLLDGRSVPTPGLPCSIFAFCISYEAAA